MVKNNFCLIVILLLFVFLRNVSSQPFSKEEKEIIELQDARTLGKDKNLLNYLHANELNLLTRSLLALANIADSNSVDSIGVFMYNNKEEDMQKLAAFALSEIPCEKSRSIIMSAILKQINGYQFCIKAAGKIGNEDDLNEICTLTNGDSTFNEQIAFSISNFAIRKVKNQNAVSKIKQIIDSTLLTNLYNRNVFRACAYALNRIGDKSLLTSIKNELILLSAMSDADIRMWSFSALGKMQDNSNSDFFLYLLDKEFDWRVKVNILNAIGNLPNNESSFDKENIAEALLSASEKDSSVHVSVTSLAVLGKLFSGIDLPLTLSAHIRESLKGFLYSEKKIDWHIRAEAVKSLAKIFRDSVKNDLFSAYSLSENYDLKAEIIRSLGNMDNGMVYREIRDSISSEVKRYNLKYPNLNGNLIGSRELAKIYLAFVQSLSELDKKVPPGEFNTMRLIYSEFLGSKDPAIVDVCISRLQDSLYTQYKNETAQILLFDYKEFDSIKDFDVMLEYIQAMGNMKLQNSAELLTANLKSENHDIAKASADALQNITGKRYEDKIIAKKYKAIDWDLMDMLNNYKYATLHTNRGDIRISLLYQYAPLTSLNFIKLSEKNFYDSTVFHRVVPNFVIQGGDWSGTGYGSPGYSVRSEFSDLRFDSYYVGMASSGKDTEGSQFFITHSPQPHLDGKYTIFGLVVDGKNVVDRIQTGDYVMKIEFSGY